MSNADKAIALLAFAMVLIWIHNLFNPVTPYRQLEKIARNKQDGLTTQAIPSRDGMRWIFLIFSETEVKKFKEEGFDNFGYQVFKRD